MWTSGASWGKRLTMDCHEHEKINQIVSLVMYTRAVFHELLERKVANISETVSKVMYVRDVSWNVGSMEKLFRRRR